MSVDQEPDTDVVKKATEYAVEDPILECKDVSLWYGSSQALHEITLDVPRNQVTALIGPSGCGKSTFLRCFNRLNDLIDGVKVSGSIKYHGQDINDPRVDENLLRKRIGMVFQKSNPFPKSIHENIAYGPKTHGVKDKAELDAIVEKSLKGAALWDEVKDRLDDSAMALSGGQMQRLCIARAIAVEPEIILMDEPCSALDPISTARVEELMQELKDQYTIIVVTHNMQQASRVSDNTAFFYLGKLIEYGSTDRMFIKPVRRETEDYITGRFG